jgi:hypothetical protein
MNGPRRLLVLQWVGVLVAPFAWFAQHVIGQGVAQARCSVANQTWGISNDLWQIGLMAVFGGLIVLSELAAVATYRATRAASYQSPPPPGRFQMFSIAAMSTHFLFLVILLLDGTASILSTMCRQS